MGQPPSPRALHRFDLNLVKVFLAIWEKRSLTQAGEVLGLTQPTLSHALQRLRDTFGDPLFIRIGNRMEPTPLAVQMCGPFQQAIGVLEHTLGAARLFDPAQSDRIFRIILTDTGEYVVLPRLLAQLAVLAPGVQVVSIRAAPAEIATLLRSGQADLAVGYQPQLEGSACHGTTLLSDRLVCLLRTGHPALAAAWTDSVFASLRFLDVSRDATGLGMGRRLLAERGIDYPIVARLEHFTVVPEVVCRTDHAALFPVSVLAQMPPRADLATRELPVPLPPYDIKIWVHDLFQADPGIVWMQGILHRALAPGDAPGQV